MWHILFGAYMPHIDFQNITSLRFIAEKILEWVNEYPQKIKLYQCRGANS